MTVTHLRMPSTHFPPTPPPKKRKGKEGKKKGTITRLSAVSDFNSSIKTAI